MADMTAVSISPAKAKARSSAERYEARNALILSAPALILLMLFIVLPVAAWCS